MNDRQFHFAYTKAGVVASIFGILAFGMGVASIIMRNPCVGLLSVHFAVASALFRVRSWLSVMSRNERNAFELGQDSARLRSLR